MNTEPASGTFGNRTEPPKPIVPKTASEALRPEAGTPPPLRLRRSRGSRNQIVVFLNFLMSAVLLLTLAAGAAVYVGKSQFDGTGPSRSNETVLIRPNTGVQEIATQLEREGLISDAWLFRLGVRVLGADSRLKAGEYEIKAGASMRDIMETLASGRSLLYSLTVPEGMTVEQTLARIARHEALAGEMPSEPLPEGSLIADTQRFTRGTSRKDLIAKMRADQQELIQSIWERRVADLPIDDINEFVTLASIVEKETGIADERPRVAGVFINRLNKGMRLQSDPTIIYGLFGGTGKPADRPIYRSDLDKHTPYNTYLVDGLPPTPIAVPGRAALEAVANPSKTDELYFVADGSGGHVFATTLDEHNENVARWRAVERQKKEEAEQAAREEAGKASQEGAAGAD